MLAPTSTILNTVSIVKKNLRQHVNNYSINIPHHFTLRHSWLHCLAVFWGFFLFLFQFFSLKNNVAVPHYFTVHYVGKISCTDLRSRLTAYPSVDRGSENNAARARLSIIHHCIKISEGLCIRARPQILLTPDEVA